MRDPDSGENSFWKFRKLIHFTSWKCIGDDEIAAGVALVRNMEDGAQREIALDQLVAELSA